MGAAVLGAVGGLAGEIFDLVNGEDFEVGVGARKLWVLVFAGGDGGVYFFLAGFCRWALTCGEFGFEAFFGDKEVVVALAEAVGFVADMLKEFKGGIGAGEFDGGGAGLDVDFFLALGEGDHHRGAYIHFGEGGLSGMKLAEAAVDEDDVGIEFLIDASVTVAAGDDFLDGFVIVDAGDGFDTEAAVAVFERSAIDEADEGTNGGFALEVGDVDTFDAADRFRKLEEFLQAFEAGAVVLEEDFGLDGFIGRDVRAFREGAEGFNLIAQGGGLFELEIFRGGVHVSEHVAQHFGAAPSPPFGIEEAFEAVDVLAVGFPGDFVGAGGGALADGVEEAGAEEAFAIIFFEDFEVAGAELEDALEVLDSFFKGVAAGEGAVEFGAGVGGLAGDVDAGIIVTRGDFKIGVGFIIEEPGVEAGLNVFDEAVFGEEGFDFRIAGEGVEVGDVFEKELFAVKAQVGGGDKVRANAVAEGTGLADVDDDAAGVFHEVNAGGGGEGFGFFAQAGEADGVRFGGAREGNFVFGLFDGGFGVEGVGEVLRGGGGVGVELRVKGLVGLEGIGREVVIGRWVGRGWHGSIIGRGMGPGAAFDTGLGANPWHPARGHRQELSGAEFGFAFEGGGHDGEADGIFVFFEIDDTEDEAFGVGQEVKIFDAALREEGARGEVAAPA